MVARYLCKNIPYYSVLLGYIWLLGTFVNSSCDIKINVNIVQNCCRNLVVRGLMAPPFRRGKVNIFSHVIQLETNLRIPSKEREDFQHKEWCAPWNRINLWASQKGNFLEVKISYIYYADISCSSYTDADITWNLKTF